MGLNTTPRTWVAAEVVTALEMNTEIRDALTGIQAAWTAYTPALTGITLNNGTMRAAYRQIGKTYEVRVSITAGSSTTYSGTFTFSLPAAAAAGYSQNVDCLGAGIVSATARVAASVAWQTSTTVALVTNAGVVTNASPAAWTTTSSLGFQCVYEGA